MHFILVFIHFLCAIFFVGYLFFDAFIYHGAKKSIDENLLKQVKKSYTKSSAKIYGVVFICLILSGAILSSFYLGGENGYFTTSFQRILALKICFVILLCLITIISLFFVLVLKRKDPFGRFSHLVGFFICLIIVFLAKILFLV